MPAVSNMPDQFNIISSDQPEESKHSFVPSIEDTMCPEDWERLGTDLARYPGQGRLGDPWLVLLADLDHGPAEDEPPYFHAQLGWKFEEHR